MSKPKAGRKPYPWRCGKCGEQAVYAGITDYERDLEYDGNSYHISLPRLKSPRCRKCGTVLLDSEANEKIHVEFLRQAKLLTPHEIGSYRQRLNLTPKILAEALGVSEETVSRWERGWQFQDRTQDNLLRLFFGLPEARD